MGSDELFSRRKEKKSKQNEKKLKKKQVPKNIKIKKKKSEEQRNSDKSSGSASSCHSVTPDLLSSNTRIVKESNDSADSLNEQKQATNPNSPMLPDELPDGDEWTMPSQEFNPQIVSNIVSKPKPSKPCPRSPEKTSLAKKLIPKNHIQIAELIKKENRVIPWIWNKRHVGDEARYRYYRNQHPLGLGIHTIANFKYMHNLLHPLQSKHSGDPNSNVKPNKIGLNEVVVRSVNIRRLRVDKSTADLNIVDEKVGIHSNQNKQKQKQKIIQIVHQNKQLQKQNGSTTKKANTPSPKLIKKNQSRSNSNPSKPSNQIRSVNNHNINHQKAKPYKQRNDKKMQSRKSTQPQTTSSKSIQPLKTAANMRLHQHQ